MTCYMKRMKPILSTIFIISASLLSLSCGSGEMEEMQSKPPEMPTKPTEEPPAPTCTEAKPIAPIRVPLSDFETPVFNEWQYSSATGTLRVDVLDLLIKASQEGKNNIEKEQVAYLTKPIDLSNWDAETQTIKMVIRHRYQMVSNRTRASFDISKNAGCFEVGKILVYDQDPSFDFKNLNPIAEWSVTGKNWPEYQTDIYFVKRPVANKIWVVLQRVESCIRAYPPTGGKWEIASLEVGVPEQKLSKQDEKCASKSPTPPALAIVSLRQAIFNDVSSVDKIQRWTYQKDKDVLEFSKPVYDAALTVGASEVQLPAASVKDFAEDVKNIQVKVYHQHHIVPQVSFTSYTERFCLPMASIALYNGENKTDSQLLREISVVGKDEVSIKSYVVPRPPSDKVGVFLNTSLDYFGDISPVCGRNAMSWKISKIEILPYVE